MYGYYDKKKETYRDYIFFLFKHFYTQVYLEVSAILEDDIFVFSLLCTKLNTSVGT